MPGKYGQKAQAHASGEVLREEFLLPLKMSAGALAKACSLPRTRIERIASERTCQYHLPPLLGFT
jgi:plasmid maintenance system antidote protein VapI